MTTSCTTVNVTAFSASAQQLANEQKFAALAKALSHPARVRIIKILLTLDNLNGCLNSDLVSQLGLAQSTVSEHLRILKQAELISAEPIPPRMCYRVNRNKLEEFSNLFSAIVD
ncbi:ArsR/SmtB family transcription factor [Ferrimonas lipolytica]|uniref:Winged helix-turn-helix transcriptional regulator n=1 Tax=Ferrimonas lipolytica TaxID=2724191 RepID=A0A6H1UI74_9GAMM|nr:metalloregulator ArsR/SmtB family transcription factor [Ferrimonas lipolytica]QIZ78329.1 winged helix-turn-helix transcriptional regulator [Ferrimonas lipolytica]